MKKERSHAGKREAQLQQWGVKIDELVTKADKAGAEIKADYRKRVDDLKAKYKAAQSKLAELNTAGDEKWETLKTGVENAWHELDTAFKKMKS